MYSLDTLFFLPLSVGKNFYRYSSSNLKPMKELPDTSLLRSNRETLAFDLFQYHDTTQKMEPFLVELKRNHKWSDIASRHFHSTVSLLANADGVADIAFILLPPLATYHIKTGKNKLHYLLPLSVPVFEPGVLECEGSMLHLAEGNDVLLQQKETALLSNPTQEYSLFFYIGINPRSLV